MSDKNLNEWLFADMEDLIDCDYSDESEAENRMTDKEIIIEKTFSEELPYFKERIKEVFDNYNNPNGNEDPLYICVLRDSNRIVRKAEEEITRQKAEINELKHERKVLIEDIHCSADKINEQLEEIEELKIENKSLRSAANCYKLHYNEARTEAYKEFAEKLNAKCDGMIKDKWNSNVAPISWAEAYSDFKDDIDNLVKEMIYEQQSEVKQ